MQEYLQSSTGIQTPARVLSMLTLLNEPDVSPLENATLLVQDDRAGRYQEGSQGSDSSSDPSEEVLDDPTNIALSQRAPAHLQRGQVLPPHGDPLLAAARPVEKLLASKDEQLPVKSLPEQQGQWKTKRGMCLSLDCFIAHQAVYYHSPDGHARKMTYHLHTFQMWFGRSLDCLPSPNRLNILANACQVCCCVYQVLGLIGC